MTTQRDLPDLDDDPQLACVAMLQTALPITRSALEARHGDWGTTGMPAALSPAHAFVLLLARLIDAHCRSLTDLLDAYRVAITNAAEDSDDYPF